MTKNTLSFSVILSFISPILSLWSLVKSQGREGKRLLFTLLIVIYGITLPMSEMADGFRHQQMVIDEYMNMSWERFSDDFFKIITFQISSSSSDLYKHVLSYFVGSILGLPNFFFFFVSLIYGYFYSGVLIEVFSKFSFKGSFKGIIIWGIIILFFLNKSVEGIQTVRTWTGLWVLVYALLRYEQTKHHKYLFLLLLPPFIHFGYFIMAIPVYIVVLMGARLRLISVIFVLSTIVNFYNPEVLAANFGDAGLIGQKLQQYERGEEELTLEAQLERKNNQNKIERTWYKKLEMGGYFKWVNNLLIYLLIFLNVGGLYMNGLEKTLLSCGIATKAGSNIIFFIFAASNRMHVIGMAFIFIAIIIFLLRKGDYLRRFTNYPYLRWGFLGFLCLAIPQFIYLLSFFLSQTSFFMVIFPWLPLISSDQNISLIEVIKNIFVL